MNASFFLKTFLWLPRNPVHAGGLRVFSMWRAGTPNTVPDTKHQSCTKIPNTSTPSAECAGLRNAVPKTNYCPLNARSLDSPS